MGQNREQLNKLLAFIDELAKDKDNAWFVEELGKKCGNSSCFLTIVKDNESKIGEIYEYCIEKVIQEQAEQFYKNFPIREIIPQLTDDFCRMERYKRENNFEDFCIAAYQQIENVVNWFCHRPKFIKHYQDLFNDKSSVSDTDGNPISVGHLIIDHDYERMSTVELSNGYFNHRLRAVLYFVYFDERTVKYAFEEKYKELNKLYLCRNLNHRGSNISSYNEGVIAELLPQKYLYYLKFTGVLVDFIEHVSRYMAKKEEHGQVINVLYGVAFVKLDNGETIKIENVRLLYKMKQWQQNDSVMVERNLITNEIIDIKKI